MERFHHFRSTDTFVLIAMCFAIFTDTFLYGLVCLLLRTLGTILTQQIIPILPYLLIQKSGVSQDNGMPPPLRNGSCSTDWIAQRWTSILLASYGAALAVGAREMLTASV